MHILINTTQKTEKSQRAKLTFILQDQCISSFPLMKCRENIGSDVDIGIGDVWDIGGDSG